MYLRVSSSLSIYSEREFYLATKNIYMKKKIFFFNSKSFAICRIMLFYFSHFLLVVLLWCFAFNVQWNQNKKFMNFYELTNVRRFHACRLQADANRKIRCWLVSPVRVCMVWNIPKHLFNIYTRNVNILDVIRHNLLNGQTSNDSISRVQGNSNTQIDTMDPYNVLHVSDTTNLWIENTKLSIRINISMQICTNNALTAPHFQKLKLRCSMEKKLLFDCSQMMTQIHAHNDGLFRFAAMPGFEVDAILFRMTTKMIRSNKKKVRKYSENHFFCKWFCQVMETWKSHSLRFEKYFIFWVAIRSVWVFVEKKSKQNRIKAKSVAKCKTLRLISDTLEMSVLSLCHSNGQFASRGIASVA